MKKIFMFSICYIISACQISSHAVRVEIAKPDGSRQCVGGGISLKAMQNQLNGIKVFAARTDQLRGVSFPAVCGGMTGQVNVYTIDAQDLDTAKQRGFSVFQSDEF